MEDRRTQIIEAGLALIAEDGLASFTQPRVAARAGIRQSHLTYYYPTRAALLAAVAHAATETQAGAARAMMAAIGSLDQAASVIAAGSARPETTRVLLALCQASEQEPKVCALFNGLADGAIDGLLTLLARLGVPATQANADLLHALFIGLAVTQLATGRPDGEARARAALQAACSGLAAQTET